VWRGFEDIEPEFAIQKICDSHDALLELPFIFWRCQVFVVLLMSIAQLQLDQL
jgi:hypothetical protein|tara:strand:- start:87 stop:245 length:159 start_codon:yes stop_codon:yes gene_type:complete